MAVIFYLSGTGNSLYAAKQLQGAFSDCRLEKIGDYLKNPYTVEDEEVGIICPVYCFALPPKATEFLRSLQAAPEYCFGIVTMGGNQGYALKEMQSLLQQKNIKLDYARDIAMPDNFFAVPKAVIEKMLKSSAAKLGEVKQELAARTSATGRVKDAWVWESFGTSMAWKYMDKMLKIYELKADDSCIGCGICVKVCPMGNIKLENDKPLFGSECAHCLGCLHWCPQASVHAGKKYIKKSNQYRHPEITTADM